MRTLRITMQVSDYVNSLAWPNDSLGMLDMVIDIEDDFDINLTMVDVAEIKNKEDLIASIERKINERESTSS